MKLRISYEVKNIFNIHQRIETYYYNIEENLKKAEKAVNYLLSNKNAALHIYDFCDISYCFYYETCNEFEGGIVTVSLSNEYNSVDYLKLEKRKAKKMYMDFVKEAAKCISY